MGIFQHQVILLMSILDWPESDVDTNLAASPDTYHAASQLGILNSRQRRFLLGIAERACDWIAHKINKILHDKKNTEDSSAIYS